MSDDIIKRRLAIFETINTVFWVALDVSWFFQLKVACAVFAAPTLLTCIVVFLYTEKAAGPLLVSGAVAFWACFNVSWVLGDLKMLAWGLAAAEVFIVLLVICLLGALIASAMSEQARTAVLLRLRRLRIGRR